MGLGFGMIFAPAINTATAGVARQDSGVASALVNTMQQVGGSIGTSALSTIALTATASYLIAHHTGPLAPAIAATHGYTTAFAVSAGAARTRVRSSRSSCCRPGSGWPISGPPQPQPKVRLPHRPHPHRPHPHQHHRPPRTRTTGRTRTRTTGRTRIRRRGGRRCSRRQPRAPA